MAMVIERFEGKMNQLTLIYVFRLLFFVPALIILVVVFQGDVGFLTLLPVYLLFGIYVYYHVIRIRQFKWMKNNYNDHKQINEVIDFLNKKVSRYGNARPVNPNTFRIASPVSLLTRKLYDDALYILMKESNYKKRQKKKRKKK